MKKMLCLALVLVMALSFAGSAMAANEFSTKGVLKQGVGRDASGLIGKTTGIGAAASGTANVVSSRTAIFQGTVRKDDGVNASNTKQFTGASSFTMTTKYDGYGNALLRTGYDYMLRIAHRSNSPVTEASCSGTWNP